MKVLFLGFTKIKYMPYMHFYLNQLDLTTSDIHLLYWDRDDAKDSSIDSRIKLHCFKKCMSDAIPLKRKIPVIVEYGRYAKKVIRDVKPDFLIVLHSTTGITVFSYLVGKFKGKYIFDFRDLTYERFGFYKMLIARVVNNSAITFTSSDGFRKFLPDDREKIITSHNLLRSSLEKRVNYEKRLKMHDKPIRIAFWGMIRHQEINRRIIEILGNDDRFELHYYGRALDSRLELLKDSEKRYKNVFYHGEYLPEERDEFAKNTDIIHNLYSNDDATTPYAMGNKFYDGLIYYIPQLCTKGSFMGEMCSKYGVGLDCSAYDEHFADIIYGYYHSLDFERFKVDCNHLLEYIINQVDEGEERIRRIINEQ